MTNLPQLEEKIYSLVPELKEPSRGCAVKYNGDTCWLWKELNK